MSTVRRSATGLGLGSRALTLVFLVVFAGYCLLPASWLIFASTKSTGDLYGTFGFWFAEFNLLENLRRLRTEDGGVFIRWMLNSLLYAGVGGLLSMLISALAGLRAGEA